eukprot:4077211-Pleurochrysis_carterae.AAC.1
MEEQQSQIDALTRQLADANSRTATQPSQPSEAQRSFELSQPSHSFQGLRDLQSSQPTGPAAELSSVDTMPSSVIYTGAPSIPTKGRSEEGGVAHGVSAGTQGLPSAESVRSADRLLRGAVRAATVEERRAEACEQVVVSSTHACKDEGAGAGVHAARGKASIGRGAEATEGTEAAAE